MTDINYIRMGLEHSIFIFKNGHKIMKFLRKQVPQYDGSSQFDQPEHTTALYFSPLIILPTGRAHMQPNIC
jgi:hypothetical protein